MKKDNTKTKDNRERETRIFSEKFSKEEKKKLVIYSEIFKAKYKDV